MRSLLYLFLFFSLSSIAQDYKPIISDAALIKEYKAFLKTNLKLSKSSYPKKYKKEFSILYKSRYESLNSRVKFDYFIFTNSWNNYFKKVINAVAKANPTFDFSRIHILVSRDEDFNAYSTGEGTIVVNIGLLNRIENESELVFILCHEFSHFILNHSDSAIYKKLQSRNAKAFKAQIKEIKKAKYDQLSKLKKVLREDIYLEKQNSRDAERQADSLGLVFLRNTRYSESGAVNSIQLLMKLKNTSAYENLNIFEYLNRQPNEIKQSTFIKGGKHVDEEDYLDSSLIKSHPELEERYESFLKKVAANNTNTENSAGFEAVKRDCFFEFDEALIKMGHFDQALLYALKQLKNNPESSYFREVVIFTSYMLYESRKEHFSGLMFQYTSITFDSARYWMKNYVVDSKLSQLLMDAKKLTEQYQEGTMISERLIYAKAMLAWVSNDKHHYMELRNNYILSYPKGIYSKIFKIRK